MWKFPIWFIGSASDDIFISFGPPSPSTTPKSTSASVPTVLPRGKTEDSTTRTTSSVQTTTERKSETESEWSEAEKKGYADLIQYVQHLPEEYNGWVYSSYYFRI